MVMFYQALKNKLYKDIMILANNLKVDAGNVYANVEDKRWH